MSSADPDSAPATQEEAPPRDGRQRGRWRARHARLLLALVAAELVYVGAFEWAARSGRLERWVNRRPEKIAISFAGAHSWFPFWGSVAGLELRGQTPRLRWRAEVDRAHGWLAPLPLLERRIRLLRPRASGVRIWLLRDEPADAEPARAAPPPARKRALPPIAPLAPPPAVPRPIKPKWSFELPGFRADAIRELWFDELRLSGEIAARGAVAMREGKVLDLEPTVAEFREVRLELGGREVGTDFAGAAELRVASLPFREKRGLDALPFVDATLRFGGRLSFGELAAPLLERAPWLALESDSSPVEGELRVVAGELRPGSRVALPRGLVRARFYDFHTEGHAAIDFAVVDDPEGARGDLAVRFDEFQIVRGRSEQPDVVGTGLSLLASTRDLRPALRLPVATATLDLGEARVPDLAVFDPVIPPTVDLQLVSGSGKVTGGVELRLPELSATGQVRSTIEHAAVRYADLELVGTVALDVALRSADIGGGRFDLSGTRFELSEFGSPQLTASTAAPDDGGWWARIALDDAEVTMPPATAARGRLDVSLRDSVPFVGLFETRRNLPRWIEKLLTVRDLRAEAEFAYRPLDFSLERFAMGFRKSKIHARMRFGPEHRAGAMMIEWHKLALGLRFDGERKKFKFVGVRDWFTRQDLAAPETAEHEIAGASEEAFSDEAIVAATFVGIGAEPISMADQESEWFEAEAETQGAAGSAPAPLALVAGSLARGELDGNDEPDGVLLLSWNPPGGPAEAHVAAITNRDGRIVQLGGRRIAPGSEIRALRIADRTIELDLVSPSGPGDPIRPRSKSRERWRLGSGELEVVEREESGPLSAADLAGERWRLIEAGGSGPLPEGFALTISFDGARFAASGPCAPLDGDYTLEPFAIVPTLGADAPATDCAEPSRNLEESVWSALAIGGAPTFTPGRVAVDAHGVALLFSVEKTAASDRP